MKDYWKTRVFYLLAAITMIFVGNGNGIAAGTLGSAGATTAIDGKQLPAPDPEFGGTIKHDALSSTPWWAPRIVPPEGAPNVLLIITDDAGFGVSSNRISRVQQYHRQG